MRRVAELPLNPRYERWRWQTFGITWLIYASFYLTRQSFGVAKVALDKRSPRRTSLAHDLGLDRLDLSDRLHARPIRLRPAGDRFGPRRILLFGMALSILAAVGFRLLDGACRVSRVRRAARNRAVDRLEQHVQDDELVVFAARARPGDRLVVYALHGGRGGGAAVRRLDDGVLRPCGVAGAGRTHGSCRYWPAAFWGPARGAGRRDRAHLVASCRTGRKTSACRRSRSITASPNRCSRRRRRRTCRAEGSWTVIREVLATPSIWLLAISLFLDQVDALRVLFLGTEVRRRKPGQRCATPAR